MVHGSHRGQNSHPGLTTHCHVAVTSLSNVHLNAPCEDALWVAPGWWMRWYAWSSYRDVCAEPLTQVTMLRATATTHAVHRWLRSDTGLRTKGRVPPICYHLQVKLSACRSSVSQVGTVCRRTDKVKHLSLPSQEVVNRCRSPNPRLFPTQLIAFLYRTRSHLYILKWSMLVVKVALNSCPERTGNHPRS